LEKDFTQKVRSARRRSSFWRVRVDNYPTLLLIFASEKYFNDALDDSSMLSIPANTNKDTKIQEKLKSEKIRKVAFEFQPKCNFSGRF